jgi:hypothetical protein
LRKVPVILVRYQWHLNFLDRFGQNLQISNFMKIHRVGVDLFHEDGRKDGQASRHDGAILRASLKTDRKKWTFQLHSVHGDGPVAVRDFISGGYCEGGVDNSNTLLKFTVQHMCHLHFPPLLNLDNRFFRLVWDFRFSRR